MFELFWFRIFVQCVVSSYLSYCCPDLFTLLYACFAALKNWYMQGVPFACDCSLNVFKFVELFCPTSHQVQRNLILVSADNVRALYLSCNVTQSKTTATLSKKIRNNRRSDNFVRCSLWEKLEDTKGIIIIRNSKKDRQYSVQRKRTNNDIQNTKQKTKDRATRIPLKTGGEIRCSGRLGTYAPLVTSVVLL